jgi:1-acyl-sn-glycerol-3-phosphate acyltransferase
MVEPNYHPSSSKKAAQDPEVKSQISPWLARLVYPIGRCFVIPSFFGKVEVSGQENVPRQGPVIIAPTHRSRWDAILVPYATGRLVTGRDLHYMVTSDEIKGLQGWFIKRLGGFPVNPRHPRIGSFRHSIELLSQGEMLAIFPEGDIIREVPVQPLKPGLARIALQAQAQVNQEIKIVPVSLCYSEIYPSWGCDVHIRIGTPLVVDHYLQESIRKGAKKLTQTLETALKELHENSGQKDSVSMVTV